MAKLSSTNVFGDLDVANNIDVGALATFEDDVDILNGDLTDGGNVIYDQSASHIPQARLQNDSVTVNAGTDLTTGGTVSLGGSVTIDHASTSGQGNVSAPSGGAISDVNLDGNGHVTSLSTVDFDGRFVAESGDSMTGRLSMYGNDVYFQPDSSGGSVTGLTFESNTNAGSDFGYIEYHDDYFGGGEESAIVLRTENDPTDKIVLDGAGGTYVETGPFDLASNDLEDSGTTIWDKSASYIPQGRLQNDSLTVAGNSVSLGGSTSVAHSNLTGIGSSDHHSRYSDSEAVSAVESNRVQDIGFDNIEDPSRTRAIGIDDSEGPLFKDSGGSTYSLWNSKYVSGGTDISISGGVGADSGSVTIDHANTSSQGNVSTGGATIIDDINLDGRGHVTNLNTQNRSLDDWQSSVDDNIVGFGSNEDFSIFYESSTDELVIRDETNSVDLIRQPKAGSTQFIQGADIGSIEAPEDSFTQTINASVTSAATSGDTVGYTFAVDNQSLLTIESTADGSGGISDKWVELQDDLRASGGEIIWDESSTYIPQGRLQNDSVTIEGNSVSLGGSTSVNHNDLSSISSNDHHSKTSSASELTDVSADSVTDAHHSKYTDSNAVSAVETNNLSSITFADSSNDANNWQLTEDGGNGHLNFTSSGGGGTQMDLEYNGNLRLEGELTEGAAL